MSADVKPCPFCGAEAESYVVPGGVGIVDCTNDDCRASQSGITLPHALDRWNLRADAEGERVGRLAALVDMETEAKRIERVPTTFPARVFAAREMLTFIDQRRAALSSPTPENKTDGR